MVFVYTMTDLLVVVVSADMVAPFSPVKSRGPLYTHTTINRHTGSRYTTWELLIKRRD